MLHKTPYYRYEPFWMNKIFPRGPQNSIIFQIFGSSFLITCPIHVEISHLGYFWPNFANSAKFKITWFSRFRNLSGKYRLLTFFPRVIRLSNYDLKYYFGPKVLEYGRKKLYILRFPQLVFVMTSPLIKSENEKDNKNLI